MRPNLYRPVNSGWRGGRTNTPPPHPTHTHTFLSIFLWKFPRFFHDFLPNFTVLDLFFSFSMVFHDFAWWEIRSYTDQKSGFPQGQKGNARVACTPPTAACEQCITACRSTYVHERITAASDVLCFRWVKIEIYYQLGGVNRLIINTYLWRIFPLTFSIGRAPWEI